MSTARSSRRRAGRVLAALFGGLLLVGPAGALEDLEEQMRQIASGLRCPVCQNLSVADSTSEMARDMRALIVDQLRAGKRPKEIRAYFVSKYGEWILLSPTPRGVGLLVWVIPALGALAGLGGAAWALGRWARRGTPPPPPVDAAVLSRLRAAVDGLREGAFTPEEARLVEGLRELQFDYRAGKLSTGDYEELRALYEARAAAALAASEKPRRAEGAGATISVPTAPAHPGPTPRAWRLAAAALFLVAFGGAVGFFLPRALRVREDGGSITGDLLTGTGSQAADMNSRDLSVLLERGRQAVEAQEFDRAIGFFRRVLEGDPAQPAAHAYLGLILLRAGHPDRALQSFDRALAGDPTSPHALWGKGLVLYESMGKTAEAVRTWESLLAQDLSKQDRDHVATLLAEARARLAGQATPIQRPAR